MLAEVVKGFLSRSASREQVMEALQELQAEFSRQRDSLEGLEDLDAGSVPEGHAYEAALARCQELVAECAGAVDGDSGQLLRLAEELSAEAYQLRHISAAFEEARLAEAGPTRIGRLNRIFRLAERASETGFAIYLLSSLVQREEQQVQQALATCSDDSVREALRQLSEALSRLREALDGEAPTGAGVDESLERLAEAAEGLSSAQDQAHVAFFHSGPTRIPQVNWILHLAQEIGEGNLGPEALVDPLESLLQMLGSLRGASAAAGGSDGGSLGEETARLAAVLDQLETCALDVEDLVINGQDPAPALDRLEAAAHRLNEREEALRGVAAVEGKVPCVGCGHYNPDDRRVCERCGGVLPKAAQERVADIDVVESATAVRTEVQMTQNLQRILSAIERAGEGELDLEGFASELDWMDGLLRGASSLIEPAASKVPVPGPLALHREGLAAMQEGLACLREACQTADGAVLEKGQHLILEGALRLQEAQRQSGQAQVEPIPEGEASGSLSEGSIG